MKLGQICKRRVVVVDFPFSDLTQKKKRPALIVKTLLGDDIILCQITSKNRGDSYSIQLSDTDFLSGSLQVPSYIRINRLFTADVKIIDSTIGQLNSTKMITIINSIVSMIQS